LPNVPLIQPAIDQPPPTKYGAVPIIPAETDTPVEPINSPETASGSENGTNNASLDVKPELDPF